LRSHDNNAKPRSVDDDAAGAGKLQVTKSPASAGRFHLPVGGELEVEIFV
jgi:hypothetical protein